MTFVTRSLHTFSYVRSPSNVSTCARKLFTQIFLVYSNLYLLRPVITSVTGNLDNLMASYLPSPLLAPVMMITPPLGMELLRWCAECWVGDWFVDEFIIICGSFQQDIGIIDRNTILVLLIFNHKNQYIIEQNNYGRQQNQPINWCQQEWLKSLGDWKIAKTITNIQNNRNFYIILSIQNMQVQTPYGRWAHVGPFHFILILLLTLYTVEVDYLTNFNIQKINPIVSSDIIPLPVILSSLEHKIKHLPTEITSYTTNKNGDYQPEPEKQGYRFRRYELKDTKYKPEDHDLSELETSILYNMEPPTTIFDVSRTITIEDYQFLEIKNIKIMLTNPTDKFRFCVNEIYADSEAVKRIQQRKLPFCLNPNNKYPFYFNLYVTEQKPIIFRTSIYFIISIYDGKELVDEKIWPREIIAKVSQNHLRLLPVQARNCGNNKNFTTITIPNPHPHHIKVSFDNQLDSQQKTQKQVMIPSQKNFKMTIISKQSIIGITTRAYEGSMSDNRFPKLFLPIYCVKPLEINNFNIGVLNTERSIVGLIVPISNNAKDVIQIKQIFVVSSTGTVELAELGTNEHRIASGNMGELGNNEHRIGPGKKYVGLCRLLAHLPKDPTQKTIIEIRVKYFLQSNPKQILEATNSVKFYELRNPLSLEGRRFFDITKAEQQDQILGNIFPIRNNLNLPLLLVRVIFDQKLFKLTWLKDRREYIYPNQKRDQFSLQYIGPKQLRVSPVKYYMILQFNGNLFIPIQLVIYDHTLQCIFNQIQQKCINLGMIDYGYFRNNVTKSKEIMVRNWNPVQKEIKIKLGDDLINKYGMNCSVMVVGPFPDYDMSLKVFDDTIVLYLKGNHYIILNITMVPLANATSGEATLTMTTQSENIQKKLKFKVQNGTIAIIPQILRIPTIYQRTIDYINLVSTYSQPYKIKHTYVNNSNILIHFNDRSEIHQNQWIGLAVVYEPFQASQVDLNIQQNNKYVSSVSTSTVPPTVLNKMCENCCGNQFFVNCFVHSLYAGEFKRFTYVSVKVITTTQLQVNSTIIIDNKPPRVIEADSFTISLINYNKNGIGNNYWNSNKESKDYKITVNNSFKQYFKFKPIIVSRSLYEDTKQYLSTMKRVRKTYEDALLCVNNAIAVKHNFSPQMVKTILGLDNIPLQVTIQPLQNQQYYVGGSQKKNQLNSTTPELTQYVRKTVAGGARVCYKMNVTKYLKQLIQSHILNDIAENYSTEIFHQFVEKQMESYNTFLHYLEYDEFYDSLEYDFQVYCKRSVYPFFRFCKQIGVTVLPNTEMVLEPGALSEIFVKAITKFKQSSQSFYLVLLNNITKSQVHLIQINITEPKLKLTKIYTNSTKYLNKKDISKLTKIKESQILQSDHSIRKYLSHTVPIILESNQSAQGISNQQRMFTITNPSTIDINITHVGFDHEEGVCKIDEIEIDQELCHGFVIKSGGERNITVTFKKNDENFKGLKTFGLFLYHEDSFYFKINVVVKGIQGQQQSFKMVAYTFILNVISFIFMMLVIWRLKQQIDQRQQLRKRAVKTKIMSSLHYSQLGTRIQKKSRKLEPIPEEQINIVKEIQQKRLKQFFNSSDESQIAKTQQAQQEQPSNNHILNVLKHDKNNISVSEQSSIDFIDLNTLNKSTHNMQEQERSGQSEANRTNQHQESIQNANENENQNDSWDEKDDGKFSDADSNFTQGDVIDYESVKKDYGWGDPTQERKKQEQSNSYYNVFFSQNPLKKKESAGLFPWMNDYQRPHYR